MINHQTKPDAWAVRVGYRSRFHPGGIEWFWTAGKVGKCHLQGTTKDLSNADWYDTKEDAERAARTIGGSPEIMVVHVAKWMEEKHDFP